MPDLTELLAAEAVRQQPSHSPTFDDLVRRTRRRHRIRAAALLGATALTAGIIVAVTAATPSPRTGLTADPPALPVANSTCRPTDLTLSLVWTAEPSGALKGTLTATNPTQRACLLLVKPFVIPEGADGTPLPAVTVTTMEGRFGPDALLPGGTATAPISWFTWCGAAAGRAAAVGWAGEVRLPTARILTTGHAQPSCDPRIQRSSNHLSSSWFEGLHARSPGAPVEVSGTLAMTGGPPGAAPDGVPGTVVLESESASGDRTTVTADSNGAFRGKVVPGLYYVTGTSPRYNGGMGTCVSQGRVYVPATGLTGVQVSCLRK